LLYYLHSGVTFLKDIKKISSPVVKRLPIYYRYISALLQLGVSRISSKDLGNRMGIASSQVRQDFSCFGSIGLQGYGYDVQSLHQEISQILGLNTLQTVIIIGAGSLGQALAKHTNFEKKGFKIVGIFDINTQLVGKKIRDLEIKHLDTLTEFVKNNPVDIAAITVPETYADEVVKLVANFGIKGLWNFAPVELKVPQDVVIENIHLIDSLIVLGYRLKENKLRENGVI
jgi:redox-sensing transcriptional repressor